MDRGEVACYIHSFCGNILFISNQFNFTYKDANYTDKFNQTGALLGYCQITTLTIISVDRYNVIVKGMAGTPLTFQKVVILILISWIWSFGWSITPLLGSLKSPLGWGYFAMDGMLGT